MSSGLLKIFFSPSPASLTRSCSLSSLEANADAASSTTARKQAVTFFIRFLQRVLPLGHYLNYLVLLFNHHLKPQGTVGNPLEESREYTAKSLEVPQGSRFPALLAMTKQVLLLY